MSCRLGGEVMLLVALVEPSQPQSDLLQLGTCACVARSVQTLQRDQDRPIRLKWVVNDRKLGTTAEKGQRDVGRRVAKQV